MKWMLHILMILHCPALPAQSCVPHTGLEQRRYVKGTDTLTWVETGKGKPLVLLHGLGGHVGQWKPLMPSLAKAGYRVLALNLPGYGGSTPVSQSAPELQLKDYADRLDAWMRDQKLQEVTLIGHSMGGQVAMLTALRQPSWLQSLVLLAPAGFETFSPQEATLLKAYAAPDNWCRQDSATIHASFQNNFFRMTPDAEALLQERLRLSDCPQYASYCETLSRGVHGMLGAPVADRWNMMQVPALVLYGERDALIPNKLLHPALDLRALVGEIQQQWPGLRAGWIPDAGHMLHWDAADACTNHILRFLRETRKPTS